jgi:hypothetical protein
MPVSDIFFKSIFNAMALKQVLTFFWFTFAAIFKTYSPNENIFQNSANFEHLHKFWHAQFKHGLYACNAGTASFFSYPEPD